MEDLISVIVPVYNSEQYLSSCIESVLKQTYSSFEVILIEDGSEDSSPDICEMLCQKDKRIRLVRQEHSGVSAARNLGIEVSQGKYLFFLDSDDLIHPQLLEALYQLQEENHTAIASEGLYYSRDEDQRKTIAWKTIAGCTPKRLYLDNRTALKYINKVSVCAIGGKMIARSAIKSVRFDGNLSHDEDKLFIYRLLVKGADVSLLCRNWYFYRRHAAGASKNFSEETCRIRYKVERYICDCEIKSGRKENAAYREWNIAVMLTEWYAAGRKNHDSKLMKYSKDLAGKERKRKVFCRLNWWMKLYFYLTFYCYPLSIASVTVSKYIRISLKFIESKCRMDEKEGWS